MAKSIGSAAKSSSRRCFTFVNVTTPTAPRTPLPTKFAVAEKHKGRLLHWEDYICWRRRQNISTLQRRGPGGNQGDQLGCTPPVLKPHSISENTHFRAP